MEAECQQLLLSIKLVEAIHFYIAQLYNNSVSVLNKVRSSDCTLVTIKRAAGNVTQSSNEYSLENWMH